MKRFCQVQILDLENLEHAAARVNANKEEIIEFGNQFCQSMKQRGGGVVAAHARIVPTRSRRDGRHSKGFVCVHIQVLVWKFYC